MAEVIEVDGTYYGAKEIIHILQANKGLAEQVNNFTKNTRLQDSKDREFKDKAERYDRLRDCLVETVMDSMEDKFEWRRD
jgi:hypothetical protein